MYNLALQKLEKSYQQQLLQAYQLFDTRQKGYIDEGCLIQGMKSLGYQVDQKQIHQMIDYIQSLEGGQKKGIITKDAFKKFMTARMDYRDHQEDLKTAFQFYDSQARGKISMSQLKRVAEELGEDLQQCQQIMKQCDKDQDGFLNYQEFIRAIKKTSYF